jgi:hypothetical protein
MLIYSPLSAYFDDVIPQQPALSNDGKQRQPALGDLLLLYKTRTQTKKNANKYKNMPIGKRNRCDTF